MQIYWQWLTLSIFFFILEVITPGVFFMWIGLGAFVTGIISLTTGLESFPILSTLFVIFSVISVLCGRKFITKKQPIAATTLNDRASTYIGKTYKVTEAIVNGRGKIAVDDTFWIAVSDSDIAENSNVIVTATNGTALSVTKID